MRCDILKLENENLKGWIKLKSKKILGLLLVVTLLSATVFGSVSVFAAGAQTNVSLESYMPPVKTIFVDDDFENRVVGKNFEVIEEGKSPYSKPVKFVQDGINVASDSESGNKYALYTDVYKRIELCDKVLPSTATRLVVSFSVNSEKNDDGFYYLRFGSKDSTKAFQIRRDNKNGTSYVNKFKSSGGTEQITNNIKPVNGWIKYAFIFEKSADNSTVLKQMFCNGTAVEFANTVDMKFPADCNWWGDPVSGDTVKAINIAGNSKANLIIDNVLVYEPYDVYMKDANIVGKSVTIVNDSAAEVSGKVFLALYDENKNLVYATEYTGEVKVPANGSLPVVLTDEIDVPNAKSAKIFFWDKGSLAPHCSAQEIDLSLIS